jgi:hypothetical protein
MYVDLQPQAWKDTSAFQGSHTAISDTSSPSSPLDPVYRCRWRCPTLLSLSTVDYMLMALYYAKPLVRT